MRNLRADAKRSDVEEKSRAPVRELNHANIYTTRGSTTRERSRRGYWVACDPRRTRVIAPRTSWQQSKRDACECISAACGIDTVQRLTRRSIAAKDQDARGTREHRNTRGRLRWTL